MFTVRTTLGHPLSPRRRLPRAVLVILVLFVVWLIDPVYVESIAMWVGLIAVLLPVGVRRAVEGPQAGCF